MVKLELVLICGVCQVNDFTRKIFMAACGCLFHWDVLEDMITA